MIRGAVNDRLEAVVRFKVFGKGSVSINVDAVIDTGFSGTLVLPHVTVAAMGLIRRMGSSATLADGSVSHFETFGAEVEWNGVRRKVVVSAVGTEALVGMRLLANQKLIVNVVRGGEVEIQLLQT